ncbi:MAG: hypothetical protein J6M06_01080 [Synergistaceae bacterium]|nr:hypothetical protein [Synergistaceae bacterium]
MSDRYLLTHSLMSSWLYTMKDSPYDDATTEKDAYGEFMQTLRREPTPTTKAMQNGIDFENLVTAILTGDKIAAYHKEVKSTGALERELYPLHEHPWYEGADDVARIIIGGQLQFKASKEITVGGMTLLLYGRLDALKAGEIFDIKFSSKYERGKYIGSTQHPVYLDLIPEAQRFTYLVSNGTAVWTETYEREDTPSVYPTIAAFLDWLTDTGNMTTYKEKWSAK